MVTYSPTRKYLSLWQKYRPAILRLMVDAGDATQQYIFARHEFARLNPRAGKAHTFTLVLSKSKTVNDIRTSEIAKDLLYMLQQSKTAIDLSEQNTYEFALDSRNVLHVSKRSVEPNSNPQEAAESLVAS